MPPYRTKLTVLESEVQHRPLVPSYRSNTLQTRTPGSTLSSTHSRSSLSSQHSHYPSHVPLSTTTRQVMDAAVTEKTRTRKLRYSGEFLDWAELQGLSERDVLPPSEAILCEYAASMAGRISGGTARAKLSAVKSWVQRKGLIWLGLDNLRNTLNGVERKAPSSSYREQHPPVKSEHLLALVDKLNLDGQNGLDYAIRAGATACFFGQLRAGEVFPNSSDDPKDYDFTQLPAVRDLGPANHLGDRKLHLPKTKVSQSRGESVVLTTQPEGLSPTKALREHIYINHLHPEDPLLAYRDENGDLKVLSKTLFLRKCNTVWSGLGIPKMMGHCFRIGGTTHFLIAGVAPDVVKAIGRWKSDAFLRYWRDLDSLASIHLHRLHAQRSYANELNNCCSRR